MHVIKPLFYLTAFLPAPLEHILPAFALHTSSEPMHASPASYFRLIRPFRHFCVTPIMSFSNTDETLYRAGSFWSNRFPPFLPPLFWRGFLIYERGIRPGNPDRRIIMDKHQFTMTNEECYVFPDPCQSA